MMRRIIVAATPNKMFIVVCAFMLIAGCTPKMDWREVRQETAGWKAAFPGKPVEVSRKLALGDAKDIVTLTLKSARIDDVMFAVGWIDDAKPQTADRLQQAMLANIQAAADSVRRKSVSIQGSIAIELEAQGMMRTDPVAPPVPARLWMRTLEIPMPSTASSFSENANTKTDVARPAKRVIEIIVVGPASRITADDARQFLDSLQLLAS